MKNRRETQQNMSHKKKISKQQISRKYRARQNTMKISIFVATSVAVVMASPFPDASGTSLRRGNLAFDAPEHIDVCVVGGGPSGVYAAYQLSVEKGENVALFEKEESLGGKCVPYVDETTTVDLPNGGSGPLRVVRHYFTSGMPLLEDWIDEIPDFRDDYLLQPDRGTSFFLANHAIVAPPPPNPAVFQLLQAYEATVNAIDEDEDHPGIISSASHENVPEELMVPFLDWADANGLLPLADLLYNPTTNFGYGLLESVPAIYILKYFYGGKLIDFFGGTAYFFPAEMVVDYISEEAVYHGTTIYKGSEVKRLVKDDNDSWKLYLKFDNNNEPSYECEKVILAHPPTSKALSIVHGLDTETRQLLHNVRVISYNEVFVRNIPSSETCSDPTQCLAGEHVYFKYPPHTLTPNVYYRITDESQLRVLFSSGEEVLEPEEVFEFIRDHMKNLFNYEPNDDDMEIYAQWSSFPHVDTPTMKDGFYEKYEGIQGKQGLYYASGLNGFELVDTAFRSAQDLVDKHF